MDTSTEKEKSKVTNNDKSNLKQKRGIVKSQRKQQVRQRKLPLKLSS